MSDLVSLVPNTKIRLFIVVPESRRARVITEVNRPTFSGLSAPLNEICRVLTYEDLLATYDNLKESRFPPTWNAEYVSTLGEACLVR